MMDRWREERDNDGGWLTSKLVLMYKLLSGLTYDSAVFCDSRIDFCVEVKAHHVHCAQVESKAYLL
jgi:hypothetical protein